MPVSSDHPMNKLFKNMPKMKPPAFDKQKAMDSHRRNLESLQEANRMATEVMKSISQLQSQYMRQAIEDMGKMAREPNAKKTKVSPQERMQKHAARMKDHVTNAIDHGSKIMSEVSKSHKSISEVWQKHAKQTTKEMQEYHSKMAPKTKQ